VRGIGHLADPFELQLDDGRWLRVRLTEISADSIRVKQEDWGDMTASPVYYPASRARVTSVAFRMASYAVPTSARPQVSHNKCQWRGLSFK
jgi:hypothetical protein